MSASKLPTQPLLSWYSSWPLMSNCHSSRRRHCKRKFSSALSFCRGSKHLVNSIVLSFQTDPHVQCTNITTALCTACSQKRAQQAEAAKMSAVITQLEQQQQQSVEREDFDTAAQLDTQIQAFTQRRDALLVSSDTSIVGHCNTTCCHCAYVWFAPAYLQPIPSHMMHQT